MLRTGTRSSKALGLVAIGALGFLAACGGGSSDSSSDETTTTTAPAGVLDPSADAAAKAGAVALTDLGAGWSQYRKGGGFVKASDESCITEFGTGIVDSDKFFSGPMFSDATKTAFVYSYVYVFRTEAAAQAFTAARNTEDFLACKERTDSAAQQTRDKESLVRLAKSTDPAVGSDGLEGFYTEEAVSTQGGAEAVSANYTRYTYRVGRVVYVLAVDTGTVTDAASAQSLDAVLATAIDGSKAAIDSRLQALDL